MRRRGRSPPPATAPLRSKRPTRPPLSSRLLDRLRADLSLQAGHHGGDSPLSARLVDQLWEEVVAGELEAGTRLPTVRELAVALSTSPRTVRRAYEQLESLGVVETRPTEGTFVSLAPPPEEEHRRIRALGALAKEAVERARALEFTPDDLIDAVAAWRGTDPTLPSPTSLESGEAP